MNRLERFRIWLAFRLVSGLGWRERKVAAKRIYPAFNRSVCVGEEAVTLTLSGNRMIGWDIEGAAIAVNVSADGVMSIVFDGGK